MSSHKRKKHPNYESEINELHKNSNSEKNEIEMLKEMFLKSESSKDKIIEKLTKDLEILTKTSKTINNITNNNTANTNNGTIQNISIVQFGREDLGKLNKKEISKILYEKGIDGLLASLEVIHFNDRLPEYKNLRLSNLNSKYIDVHNGKTWIKDDKDKIIMEKLDNHSYNLQVLCEENPNDKIKNSVKNFIDDLSGFNNIETESKNTTSNKKLTKKINARKEEVKLFMYNKSKNDNVLDI